MGHLFEAEKEYRQALKLHKGSSDDLGKIRIALARILQRDRTPAVSPEDLPESMNEDSGEWRVASVQQANENRGRGLYSDPGEAPGQVASMFTGVGIPTPATA